MTDQEAYTGGNVLMLVGGDDAQGGAVLDTLEWIAFEDILTHH